MLLAYLKVIQRELKRFYKRPLIWNIGFFMPMFMSLAVCLIFAQGSPRNLPVAVYNQDNSDISRMFVRSFNSLPSCKIKYQVSSLREGERLLQRGDIYAFLVIPKDFQKDMINLKQPKLVLYYNNQRILVGSLISKDVNYMVQTLLVGIDATVRNKHGLPMHEAIKQSNLISVSNHALSNPYFNYQYFLALISIGHIVQIHIVLTALWALGSEFKLGTTKMWLKMANDNIFIAFLGKMTPYFLLFLVMFVNLFTTYYIFTKAPFNGNWLTVIFSTMLFISACFALSTIFISLDGNFRNALSNAAFYVAMGFAFSGITYPTMSMPMFAQVYSWFMPLFHWIRVMIDQALRGAPPHADARFMCYMFLLMILGFLSLIRLKKLAKDEKRWYQS